MRNRQEREGGGVPVPKPLDPNAGVEAAPNPPPKAGVEAVPKALPPPPKEEVGTLPPKVCAPNAGVDWGMPNAGVLVAPKAACTTHTVTR